MELVDDTDDASWLYTTRRYTVTLHKSIISICYRFAVVQLVPTVVHEISTNSALRGLFAVEPLLLILIRQN